MISLLASTSRRRPGRETAAAAGRLSPFAWARIAYRLIDPAGPGHDRRGEALLRALVRHADAGSRPDGQPVLLPSKPGQPERPATGRLSGRQSGFGPAAVGLASLAPHSNVGSTYPGHGVQVIWPGGKRDSSMALSWASRRCRWSCAVS